MIGMQDMGDMNTTVPEWFGYIMNSGLLWIIMVGVILLIVILVVLVCQNYYELKEINDYFEEHNNVNKG